MGSQSTSTAREHIDNGRQPFQPLQVASTTKRRASGENPPDFKKPMLMYEQISPAINEGDENFINLELSEFLQKPFEDAWE